MNGSAGSVHLLGGGWDARSTRDLYAPFLESAGRGASIAVVVLDEGDGAAQFARWEAVLRRTDDCDPRPVLVPLGSTLDVAALPPAQGMLVCGGLTPAYADALAPAAGDLRAWLAQGRAYAGFSAGAAIAAEEALVGGWRLGGRPVCPEDASEELDEVKTVAGLGLVPWTVEVHCAQWGTLPRLLSVLRSASDRTGIAIDENTAVHIARGTASVVGLGQVHHVSGSSTSSTTVRTLSAGQDVPLP